jgi:hypothetical protein
MGPLTMRRLLSYAIGLLVLSLLCTAASAQAQHSPSIRASSTIPTLVVTSAADNVAKLSGCPSPGATNFTLRCAVMQANHDCAESSSSGGCEQIAFDIPQNSQGCASPTTIQTRSIYVCTISFVHGALTLTGDNVSVNGFTAAPASFAPGTPSGCQNSCGAAANSNSVQSAGGNNAAYAVVLDGSSASRGTDGFIVEGWADSLSGLDIVNFRPSGSNGGAGAAIAGGTCTTGLGACQDSIWGNLIGMTQTNSGDSAAPNGTGVVISSDASDAQPTDDVVGGQSPSTANVIGDNAGDGVDIIGSLNDTISGNFIGTDQTGQSPAPNGSVTTGLGSGVAVNPSSDQLPSTGITVGGSAAGSGNLISGNVDAGVLDWGWGDSILGNYIGTDSTGNTAIPNYAGITCLPCNQPTSQYPALAIGGPSTGEGNLISGNSYAGIIATTATVQGNFIGLNEAGTKAVGNGSGGGLQVVSGSLIGGTAAGDGNVISGNVGSGPWAGGINLSGNSNTIQGNFIGTDKTGTIAIPNGGQAGLSVISQTQETSFQQIGPGNVISGNAGNGVNLGCATNSYITGNIIGLDKSGSKPLGNGKAGVYADCGTTESRYSALDRIGGTSPSLRNIISANQGDGVDILNASRYWIFGNYIGTDVTGTNAEGNGGSGVVVGAYSTTDPTQLIYVGGASSWSGNVISGNRGNGVVIHANAIDSSVGSDLIGVSVSGTAAIPNGGDGVLLSQTADDTIQSNTIAGNASNGVEIDGMGGAKGNNILGNRIGVFTNGKPDGNEANGIFVHHGATANTLGGPSTNQPNTVVHNGLSGVAVTDNKSQLDISRNVINDNVLNAKVEPGTAGEIYVGGESLATCSSTVSGKGADQHLPCPIVDAPDASNDVVVQTCAGCQVNLYSFEDREPYDQQSGGSGTWLASKVAPGKACNPSKNCADLSSVTFTHVSSVVRLTATATSPDGSVTSPFGQDWGLSWATHSLVKKKLTVQWRMATQNGVQSFNIYSGSTRVNATPIKVHPNPVYSFQTDLKGTLGKLTIRLKLASGGALKVPVD